MVPCIEILIGKLKFTTATEINIKKSWRTFTDTAAIKLPKAIYYYDINGILKPVEHLGNFIKVGDQVEIKLGYNRQLFTEFTGYVARSPRVNIPYELICEDEMWQLKRKETSVSIENATVQQIIQAVAPGYELDCIDEVYGDFSMKQTTAVKVFNELQEKAGIYTFFRDGRLVCGKIYSDEKVSKTQPVFEYCENIIDHNLQYIFPDEAKVKLYAKSKNKDGSYTQVEVGEDGGDIEHWEVPAMDMKEKELKTMAENRLKSLKRFGGYKGTITSFGWSRVEHGQVVQVKDKKYEERNTKNFVDEVEINVSATGGYRRTIDIGRTYRDGEFKKIT
ncbi:phage late control D family protein [Chryseobacterium rhizoplanae]|uniref:phage late control D family protein n=1 Tax=Chryseobacterium rhizoplanae TaxID=1609531 RepID=UPI001CE2F374|nr:phage late control D family protein [Chryseobacterium rhizoplanae]UCA61661.1 phage late control D family protein [Chryseobacterium rhizoplanae]